MVITSDSEVWRIYGCHKSSTSIQDIFKQSYSLNRYETSRVKSESAIEVRVRLQARFVVAIPGIRY